MFHDKLNFLVFVFFLCPYVVNILLCIDLNYFVKIEEFI